MKYDVIIIGSGPAGMSAALYLKRANVSCCILEKGAPGGQMNQTAMVENYPGFEKITGPQLALSMWKQVTSYKTDYIYDTVLRVEVLEDEKIVYTKTKKLYCHYLIVASGKTPRKLGLPNEEKLLGKGISYCAICDGPLYKGKEVAVVGGGNSALEESLYLASLCKKVYLIHRRDTFRGDKALLDAVKQKDNITILSSTVVLSFQEEDGKLKGLKLKRESEETELSLSGVFLFLGQTPNTSFLEELSLPDQNGYIPVDASFESKIPGLYAVGDVVEKNIFQIVLASSEGVQAALAILKKMGV